MGAMYSAPRLRLGTSSACATSARSSNSEAHPQGILRTPCQAVDQTKQALPQALAEQLAVTDQPDDSPVTELLPARARVIEAYVRAAVQNDSSSVATSPKTTPSNSPRPRPRRTLSTDSLPSLRVQALSSAMARPAVAGAASSWRSHANNNSAKDNQGDLRRWRSCGSGALASGTHAKLPERRARYRGSDEKALKAEVRAVRTGSSTEAVHQPSRSVQPPGGLMVRRLSLADCERATDEALGAVLRVTDLTQLCLDRCVRLTDNAMDAVATQRSLRELSLAGCCQVGNVGVAQLRALRNLRVLSLERCGRLTDDGLAGSLCEWTKMQVLNLGFCYKLTTKSVGNVRRCARLAYLDVRSTRVTSEFWRAIATLKRLRALYASNTALTDEGSRNLECAAALRALDVAGTQVGDALLASISGLPLETLNLAYTAVSDGAVAKHVTKMHTLRWLSLDDTDIGDYAVERMGTLCLLGSLNLADTSVTAFGVGAVASLPTLKSLDLSFTGVTDATLRSIAKLTGLRRLRADGEHVSDQGAVEISRLTQLQELELYGANVTDQGAASLAHCTEMRVLELCMARISDAGAESLAVGMRLLRSVNMRQNRIGSKGALAFLRECAELCTLNLGYCQKVRNDVLAAMRTHSSLSSVCVQGTMVTISAAASLRKAGLVVVCDTLTHANAAM